jgi:superfamily II DNA or RNA helicase
MIANSPGKNPFERDRAETIAVRNHFKSIRDKKSSQYFIDIDRALHQQKKGFFEYQARAVKLVQEAKRNRVLSAPRNGSDKDRPKRFAKSSLVVSPTGSGKTSIFSADIVNDLRKGKRILVLDHREYLDDQIAERLVETFPEADKQFIRDNIQVLRGAKSLEEASAKPGINIASVHTLMNPSLDLPNFFKQFDSIVIDEAHHYTAKSFLDTLDRIIRLTPKQKEIKILGATATPLRHTPGEVPMSDIFPAENVVWTQTQRQLIMEGRLKEPRGIRLDTNLGSDLRIDAEDQNVNKEDIKALARNPEFNELLFDTWEEHKYNDRGEVKNTLVFANDTTGDANSPSHIELLFDEAKKRGIAVAMVDGNRTWIYDPKTKEIEEYSGDKAKEKRSVVTNRFGKDIKMIINCKVYTEGVDLPQTESVVFGSVTRSIPELQQIVGRGSRINPEYPDDREFDFIYLDPQTANKVNFANLATLGLDSSQINPGSGVEGNVPGEPKPMYPFLSATGYVDEGYLINKPDQRWVEILKNAAFNKFNCDEYGNELPESKQTLFPEHVKQIAEYVSLNTTSKFNIPDVVVASDLIFGVHDGTKLREAQKIFSEVIDYLDTIDKGMMQTCFPRLTGFDSYDALASFLQKVYISRPDVKKATSFLNQKYKIDSSLILKLAEEKFGQRVELSEVFDDIWKNRTWNDYYQTVKSHLSLNPGDADLSREAMLENFNNFLRQTLKSKVEFNMNDFQSIADFKSACHLNNLDDKLSKHQTELENSFYHRLEMAIWLDENRTEIDSSNLEPNRVEKLAELGVTPRSTLSKRVSGAEKKRRLETAVKIFAKINRGKKTAGKSLTYMDDHRSINEALEKILSSLLRQSEIDALKSTTSGKSLIPTMPLDTKDKIKQALIGLSRASSKFKAQKSEIEEELIDHLEITKWLAYFKDTNPVTSPRSVAQRNISKLVKKITKE